MSQFGFHDEIGGKIKRGKLEYIFDFFSKNDIILKGYNMMNGFLSFFLTLYPHKGPFSAVIGVSVFESMTSQ